MVLLYNQADDVLIDLYQQVSRSCIWRNGLKIFYHLFMHMVVLYYFSFILRYPGESCRLSDDQSVHL